MKIIEKLKVSQVNARKARNKEEASVYTMTLSRADADRVKYGLKSSDELDDGQMTKIIEQEIKSIEQELRFARSEDEVTRLEGAIYLLSLFIPEEMSLAEVEELVAAAANIVDPKSMKEMIATVKHLAKDSDKTLPMGIVSKVIKASF